MRVAIVGASGYTGLELVRIVLRHPELELVAATSEQRAGEPVGECFPFLRSLTDLRFEAADAKALAKRVDVAFCALPHAASARIVTELHRQGVTVLDLSADFRLRDMDTYVRWYGEHAAPDYFGKAVYGLTEHYRDELVGADLVAAPGCYPTGALLPLLPFLKATAIETQGIVVDSKSGVSGAGRKLDDAFLFAELDSNSKAYKVANHRHGSEMTQEASVVAGEPVGITFIPYLIPTIRGIVTTVITRPTAPITTAAAREILLEAYADAPFVRVLGEGETPSLASVRGSNFCDVSAVSDETNGTLILLSAIDNLVKGSGGQAVQCLNLMRGWPETTGLLEAALVP